MSDDKEQKSSPGQSEDHQVELSETRKGTHLTPLVQVPNDHNPPSPAAISANAADTGNAADASQDSDSTNG